MTKRPELILVSKHIDGYNDPKSLKDGKKEYENSYIIIDEFKLLEYKSDPESENFVKNKNEQAEASLRKSSKIIILTVFISSIVQSIFFVFILPTKFIWPDHILVFLLVFGWCVFFDSIFFEPDSLRKLSNYLNEALTDYDNLGI